MRILPPQPVYNFSFQNELLKQYGYIFWSNISIPADLKKEKEKKRGLHYQSTKLYFWEGWKSLPAKSHGLKNLNALVGKSKLINWYPLPSAQWLLHWFFDPNMITFPTYLCSPRCEHGLIETNDDTRNFFQGIFQ